MKGRSDTCEKTVSKLYYRSQFQEIAEKEKEIDNITGRRRYLLGILYLHQ